MNFKLQKFISIICVTTASVSLSWGLNVLNMTGSDDYIAQAQTPQQQVQVRPIRASTSQINQLRRLFPQRTLLPQQTFQVRLIECGTCLFVPTITSDRRLITHLVKNNKIILTFPQSQQLIPQGWRLSDFKAVSFLQLGYSGPNEDGIIIIADYITGIGRNGAKPFPVTIIYQRNEGKTGFSLVEKESLILTERRVRTISQAETILRNEFQYLP